MYSQHHHEYVAEQIPERMYSGLSFYTPRQETQRPTVHQSDNPSQRASAHVTNQPHRLEEAYTQKQPDLLQPPRFSYPTGHVTNSFSCARPMKRCFPGSLDIQSSIWRSLASVFLYQSDYPVRKMRISPGRISVSRKSRTWRTSASVICLPLFTSTFSP